MAYLTPSQVHVDTPLTNLTVAYIQSEDAFIADKVFPNVPVSKKSDSYYIYDRSEFIRSGDVKSLAPRTRPERVGLSLSTDTYNVDVRALATDFDTQTLANEDTALDIRAAGARMLTQRLLIDREQNWINNYFATGVWTTEYTGVTNADNDTATEFTWWSDYTNSTPIQDVTTAKRAGHLASGGFKPNVMVITQDVKDVLVNHPDIIDRIDGGATTINPALVTDRMLAQIFDVEEVLVIEAVENTGGTGAPESLAYLETKKAALYYRPAAPGLMVPAAGYNFTWTNLENSSGYGVSTLSYSGDYLTIEGIAEEIHVVMGYDQKVVGAEMGVFMNSIIE